MALKFVSISMRVLNILHYFSYEYSIRHKSIYFLATIDLVILMLYTWLVSRTPLRELKACSLTLKIFYRWIFIHFLVWCLGCNISVFTDTLIFSIYSFQDSYILFFICWSSSVVYLLDWNEQWQTWPQPTMLACISGSILQTLTQ